MWRATGRRARRTPRDHLMIVSTSIRPTRPATRRSPIAVDSRPASQPLSCFILFLQSQGSSRYPYVTLPRFRMVSIRLLPHSGQGLCCVAMGCGRVRRRIVVCCEGTFVLGRLLTRQRHRRTTSISSRVSPPMSTIRSHPSQDPSGGIGSAARYPSFATQT
jgi:hypothetical protein